MKQILAQLEDSSSSAALAVFDHLTTVAANGPEYSTDEAMLCEAENLKEWAEMIIEQLTKKGTK
jgi:hypothetical protein